MLWSLIAPFVTGGCIAFVLNIPVRALERKVSRGKKEASRWKRIGCILLVLGTIILAGGGVVWLVIAEVGKAGTQLAGKVPAAGASLKIWTDQFAETHSWAGWILEQADLAAGWKMLWKVLQESLDEWMDTLLLAAGGIGKGVVRTGVGIVLACYILIWKEQLARQLELAGQAFLREEQLYRIRRICSRADHIFTAYITGQCKEAVVLGCVFACAMLLFRFPYVSLISILIGLTSFVPIAGSFVGCVVGAMLIMVENPVGAVWFIIVFLGIQQIESNFIYPRIVGGSVGLPPLWVLAAVTVGGTTGGAGGIFLSVPVCAFLYSCIREVILRRAG